MTTSWRRVAFDTILVLGLIATALVLAYRKDAPARLDCAALCAPRAVLAGEAGACVCAPDATWIIGAIEACDRACGPVPFDVSAQADGSVECKCGRPDKIRKWARIDSKEN